MARSLNVRVRTYGKTRSGAYKVTPFLAHTLVSAFGWRLVTEGRSYHQVEPPLRTPEPLVLTVQVPTQEAVMFLAEEKHRLGQQWMGYEGFLPARYLPSEQMTIQDVDIFAGTKGPEQNDGSTYAQFAIGDEGLWQARVTWDRKTGAATYSESCDIADGQIEAVRVRQNKRKDQPPALSLPDDDIPEAIPPDSKYFEGATQAILVNRFERNQRARAACLTFHGIRCLACGQRLQDVYGDVAKGLIHVHHLVPLSSIDAEYELDPEHDLVPLCPNCHAVAHRRDPPLSVEEIQALLTSRE